MNSAAIFYGVAGGMVILGSFAVLGASLYLAYARKDQIVECFKNSPGVTSAAPSQRGAIRSHLMWISTVTSYVAFPRGHLRRGEVDRRDLDALPASLRRELIVLRWTLLSLCGSAILLFVFGKSVLDLDQS